MKYYVWKSMGNKWCVSEDDPSDLVLMSNDARQNAVISKHLSWDEAYNAAYIYAQRSLVGGSY